MWEGKGLVWVEEGRGGVFVYVCGGVSQVAANGEGAEALRQLAQLVVAQVPVCAGGGGDR